MYYLIVPALVEAMVSSNGPDEDKGEGWGEWAGKAIAAEVPAGIPILRDIAKAGLEGRSYEVSPLARAIDTIIGTAGDIKAGVHGQEPSKRWLQHAIETAGYVTGWPSGQAGASAQFLWDYNDGDAEPASVADWAHGLIFGRMDKQ